ncbi:MAG: PQQ-dependent sugar dehydrogenase [Roseiflexaceae bacterium]|nr:PQQ-dependent sugar dehydrogenase [Roseiflexaceae bacterium]
MPLIFVTILLLTVFVAVGALGIVLLRRSFRALGIALVLAAALAIAAQVVLSTVPFGIGEPLIRVPFVSILAQTLGALAVVTAAAAAVYLLVRWASRRQRYATLGIATLALVPLIAGAGLYGLAQASLPERERERDPRKREISLEPGFAWTVYAEGTIDNPTVITFGPDGKLYIADISGTLWVATDRDQDFQIDTITPFAEGFSLLVGLAWRDGELYAASSGKIEALRDTDGDDRADARRSVVEGLPSMVLQPHSNNSIVFGPDGRLYFGVGATTSGDFEPNELAAKVLSVNADGSDLKTFASGFGNTFGVAFNAAGELFGGDNSPGQGAENPDEFNHIVEGENYGYPYVYGDPEKNYGTRGALVSFPAHSTPTGMSFYGGDAFPAAYRDTAFVTLWTRGELARIELAKTSGGEYLSRRSTFGTGFLYPIAAITGPDGNLYVADFGTSAVYRITYTGG